MDQNLIRPYDKELMKMAMLKHEETFKEQVYELHRLYRIQKVLMKTIQKTTKNGRNQDRWNSRNATNVIGNEQRNTQQRTQQNTLDHLESDGDGGVVEIEDETLIELTLGPTSYYRRKKAETPMNSDSGPSFSSSSTSSSHIKRKSLETQVRRNSREGIFSGQKWGLMEEHVREDRLKQPPWILQALSLNMA